MQHAQKEVRLAFFNYLEAYFSHRDFDAAVALFLPTMTGYGTGFDEKSYTYQEMVELYARDISQVPDPIQYMIKNLHIDIPSHHVGIVLCELDICMYILEQEVKLNHLRLSMFWVKKREAWYVAHMHISLPTEAHEVNESYPIKELEERNKVLERMVEKKTLKLSKALETISQLATIDKLTKIFNRFKMEELLSHELERSRRYHNDFSVIYMDIDYFKHVNDTFGHVIGDKVLCEFTHIISKRIRHSDAFGRWGGEEFIIVCPQTPLQEAIKLAETLRYEVEQHSFKIVGHKTASYGVVSYCEHDTIDSLLRRADRAMYEAKNNGRNQVFFIPKE